MILEMRETEIRIGGWAGICKVAALGESKDWQDSIKSTSGVGKITIKAEKKQPGSPHLKGLHGLE